MSGSGICRILEQNGFTAVTQRGSHRIMQKRLEATTITVPVPLHDPVRRGTMGASSGSRSFRDRCLKSSRSLCASNIRHGDYTLM
ncbi:MAG: type II toxin-antitoxin system HicA family toxin [Bryobacteraceae bacterium]